jgi:hypothetical protein
LIVLPWVSSEAEADGIAEAQLDRLQRRAFSGVLIAPMNCGQEMWDLVEVTEQRAGWTGANVKKLRVGGIVRTFQPGKYEIELTFGGLVFEQPDPLPILPEKKEPPELDVPPSERIFPPYEHQWRTRESWMSRGGMWNMTPFEERPQDIPEGEFLPSLPSSWDVKEWAEIVKESWIPQELLGFKPYSEILERADELGYETGFALLWEEHPPDLSAMGPDYRETLLSDPRRREEYFERAPSQKKYAIEQGWIEEDDEPFGWSGAWASGWDQW